MESHMIALMTINKQSFIEFWALRKDFMHLQELWFDRFILDQTTNIMINSSHQKLLFWLGIRKLFHCLLDLLLCQRMIELDTHNKLIFEYASLTRFLCNWLRLYPKWSISSSSILKIFFASFLPYEICDLTCFCSSFSFVSVSCIMVI